MIQQDLLRARDLMTTDVATLLPDTPVREALELFEELHVSGAPVLDEAGEPVGFLSLYDVVRSGRLAGDRADPRGGGYEMADPPEEILGDEPGPEVEGFEWKQDYSERLRGRERVEDWMSHGVITVTPDATLREVCSTMTRESVHRVLVRDGEGVQGILSAMDVVRKVAES